MIHNIENTLNRVQGGNSLSGSTRLTGGAPATDFASTLKNAVGDVAQLQRDAQHAVEDLATGKTDDLAGVMMAVEKSDLAFNTLLSV